MKKNNILPLLTVGLMACALVLSIGLAQARYRENLKETVPFQVEEAETLTLREQTGWVINGNTSTLTFSVENPGQVEQKGKIYMLASQGLQSGEKLTVTLTQSQQVYTATAEPIQEGSALYKSFGKGWIYRFLDGQGQEQTWPIDAGSQLAYQLKVQSNSAIRYDSLIRLIVAQETE